jgi:plasmid maintenance system antidote protein VapI
MDHSGKRTKRHAGGGQTPQGAVNVEIVSGKRAVTADTDIRLCRYFGLSDGWWLRGQAAYDTAVAKEALHKELATIQRCSLLKADLERERRITTPDRLVRST